MIYIYIINFTCSRKIDLVNSAPAILPVTSADELLLPVPVGSKQPNDDSTSADEHSPVPLVSKQPNDNSPSADEHSPVPVGSGQPNDESSEDEIQTNSVPAGLQVSSVDEHSLVHVESIQPNDDSPSDEDANLVPAIHPILTSDENSPVHNPASDADIAPPVLDKSGILSDESDESNKPYSMNSDLAKDRNSGNLVGCSNESTAEVSESSEVKSIDALMEEVMIFPLFCDFIYLYII